MIVSKPGPLDFGGGAIDENVRASAAVYPVGAAAAEDEVVAVAAEQSIVARAGQDAERAVELGARVDATLLAGAQVARDDVEPLAGSDIAVGHA